MNEIETRDVRVKIEEAQTIYIGQEAVDVLRDDAHRQLHETLTDIGELWNGDSDVEDVDHLKTLEYRLSIAGNCVSALIWLAPLEDNGEDS